MAAAGALAVLAQFASAGLQAWGQYMQYSSAEKWSNYNAAVTQNQQIAVRQSAEFTMQRTARSKERFLSRQVARYGKAGVQLEGSPAAVMADTATEFDLDILAEKYNADLQIMSLESERQGHLRDASNYRFLKRFVPATTLLTGATNAAVNYKSGGGQLAQREPLTATYQGRVVQGVRV